MPDFSLSIERDIAANPATIWRCLTDPALLREWFAPKPVIVTHVELDPSPGGAFRVVMDVPEMGEIDGGVGCILKAVPNESLIWTSALGPNFVPKPAPGEGEFHFTARFQLAPLGPDHTRYTASGFHATQADRDRHADMGFEPGWGAAADQLATLAAQLNK